MTSPRSGPIGPVDRERPTSPTWEDPTARAASEVIGGPQGRHGVPGSSWWTPVRVLLALFVVGACLSVLHHVPCGNANWAGDSARYGKMCYSDVPYLYTGRGFAEHRWPYAETTARRFTVMEYPVGISYLAWGASWLTVPFATGPPQSERRATSPDELSALPGMAEEVNRHFVVTAVLLLGLGLVTTWFLARTHRGRPWDALPFVLSPVLILTQLINWDLLAVVFTAGAVWAWARGRPVWTGVMIGLGTAAKLYPLFLLGALLVVVIRRREWTSFAIAVGAAAAAWVLANLPAWWTGPEQWRVFWTFNSERGPDLGSFWLVLAQAGVGFSTETMNHLSWVLFALACLGVLILGLRAKRPPRVAQLGFLIVAAFLLVNKVYSPQYVLWLLPLAVLARPRWRDLLIWQAGEVFYFAMVWMYLGGWLNGGSGNNTGFYPAAIVIRMAAEIYLMAVVTRDILRPERDPVSEGREPDRASTDSAGSDLVRA